MKDPTIFNRALSEPVAEDVEGIYCSLCVCVSLYLSISDLLLTHPSLPPSLPPFLQAAFAAASSGDKEAMEKVEQALNGKLYPNINTDVLKVGDNRGQEGGREFGRVQH